jgi:hypothetical protein
MVAAKKKPIKTGACSGHIPNLKQSILETFDIYGKKATERLTKENIVPTQTKIVPEKAKHKQS